MRQDFTPIFPPIAPPFFCGGYTKRNAGWANAQLDEWRKMAINIAAEFPLLETGAQRIAIAGAAPAPGSSVYAGFGLVGKAGLSVATPFDVMSMVLAAEAARRHRVAARLLFLVADTHALKTGNYSPEEIDRAAERLRGVIKRASELIGVPEVEVIRASELDAEPGYQRAIAKAMDFHRLGENEYFLREAADVAFLCQAAGVVVKIGWTLASNPAKAGRFDEQSFDAFTCRTFPEVAERVSFLYTKAGRTLNQTKPKAAPYLTFETSSRVLVRPGENARKKIEACQHNPTRAAVIRHLEAIIGAWEALAGTISGNHIFDKVNAVIPALAAGTV